MTRTMAQAVAQYLVQHGLEAQVMAAGGAAAGTPRDAWGVLVRDGERGPLFAITSVIPLQGADE